MPIEIRELVIRGSLARDEDRGDQSEKLPLEKDLDALKEDIISTMNSQGGSLATDQRRQLIEEIMREVRKLMDDRWRR